MKIAICDDEVSDLKIIHSYCKKSSPDIPVKEFLSGKDLLAAFDADFYDLVFLDIEMGAPDGLTVGAELTRRAQKPVIIFTTHSLNYAVRGYGIALRYLPKPITYPVFQSTLRIALDTILPQKIWLQARGSQLHVSVAEILYFEVLKHQVTIHLNSGKSLLMRGSLSDIIDRMPHRGFVQPHKSYYINMEYIDYVTGQDIMMTNGDIIPIARGKKEQFLKSLSEYMKGSGLNEYLD